MLDTGAQVTHVVAADVTEKTRWGEAHGKFVVSPNWLWCCGEYRSDG